jgi:hypothetical protein
VGGADVTVPLAAVILNQEESVRILTGIADRDPGHDRGFVPAYSGAQIAAEALARAAAYGRWRARAARPDPGLSRVGSAALW